MLINTPSPTPINALDGPHAHITLAGTQYVAFEMLADIHREGRENWHRRIIAQRLQIEEYSRKMSAKKAEGD